MRAALRTSSVIGAWSPGRRLELSCERRTRTDEATEVHSRKNATFAASAFQRSTEPFLIYGRLGPTIGRPRGPLSWCERALPSRAGKGPRLPAPIGAVSHITRLQGAWRAGL